VVCSSEYRGIPVCDCSQRHKKSKTLIISKIVLNLRSGMSQYGRTRPRLLKRELSSPLCREVQHTVTKRRTMVEWERVTLCEETVTKSGAMEEWEWVFLSELAIEESAFWAGHQSECYFRLPSWSIPFALPLECIALASTANIRNTFVGFRVHFPWNRK